MTTANKIFYSVPQDHIRDYVYHGNHGFDTETLEALKVISKAIMILSPPPKPIIVTTKAMPLIIPNCLSLTVGVATMMLLPPTHLLVALVTDLVIIFALATNMTPVCHVFASTVVSVMTPAQSNELFVRCIFQLLVPKLPKTLKCYTKLQNHLNHTHWFENMTKKLMVSIQCKILKISCKCTVFLGL